MNHIVVVGELKEDARIINGQYTFLTCTIIQRQAGYGQNSSKVFKKYFKGIVFGKNVNELAGQLKAGVWVEASGEADCEAYLPKNSQDGKPKGMVTIKGQVKVLVTADSVTQAAQPRAAAPAAQESDPATDDVPF